MSKAEWVKVKSEYGWEKADGYSLQAETPDGISTYLTFFLVERCDERKNCNGYVCYVRSRFLKFDTWEGNSVPGFFKTVEEAKEYFYNRLVEYIETQITNFQEDLKFLK